jgi:hypothetical protein
MFLPCSLVMSTRLEYRARTRDKKLNWTAKKGSYPLVTGVRTVEWSGEVSSEGHHTGDIRAKVTDKADD